MIPQRPFKILVGLIKFGKVSYSGWISCLVKGKLTGECLEIIPLEAEKLAST